MFSLHRLNVKKFGVPFFGIHQPKEKSGIESELPVAMSEILNCYGINGKKS